MGVSLNDGIFHPMYNPNGWRQPKDGTDSDPIYWNNTSVVIENSKDCFDKTKIDATVTLSGRPDGNYLAYGSGTNIEEWN